MSSRRVGVNAASQWSCFAVRPRHEIILARELALKSVHHFLPVVRVARTYAGVDVDVTLPLFKGFIFIHGSDRDVDRVTRTSRILAKMEIADRDELAHELKSVQIAIDRKRPLVPCPPAHAGSRVEVVDGGLRGVRGILPDGEPQNKLVLNVSAIGCGAQLTLNGERYQSLI